MNSIGWYEQHAATVIPRYESLQAEAVHRWLLELIPARPSLVLDIGAGSGRDAAWLAAQGHEVIAVEPAAAMREEGQRLHPSARIRWIDDHLPVLQKVHRLGMAFDFILLSAVWMHIPPAERSRAFRKIITLLKPGGLLAITLRHGEAEAEREIYGVSWEEIERLAREHGATIVRKVEEPDQLARSDVSWTKIAISLPDDGTGALPLLRHIILNDSKSSTYKLALLRVICRIADSTAGTAHHLDDEYVSVPLGLVALYWIRLFKPLLQADLPQNPTNRGAKGLGFAGEGFRSLSSTSHLDLRIGARFSGTAAKGLHQALKEAVKTIAEMPAHYLTYPNGSQILKVNRCSRLLTPPEILIDTAYLASFGQLLIPKNIWLALLRFEVWVEPALIAEWIRLMKGYASGQGRPLNEAELAAAMTWSDPSRDVTVARQRAIELLSCKDLFCVWSGKRLNEQSLDMDHCFPWSAWACDDLWNLMPSDRRVNQHQKRDRLPGAEVLRSAEERVQFWWDAAYLQAVNPLIPVRFTHEARASLPGLFDVADPFALDDLFTGIMMQQVRLKYDQQVPEWTG
ncbi:methyltransferase domain-containing protein [Leptolyngbya sp. FACHB-541]|uniref:class I SAM-dependent methyltransferase n=1 Tax=Leptolyngbya sp. FACHB-541 TaxID=2692810 RepID=UPI0016838A4C|nr:class I SAM-dependent methyltransferase [Leptolyngbya sp. FACHB-541]MBD1999320.1 methyltransferase domain-containing protein [Leptolyngbya sp. FACHB-541]